MAATTTDDAPKTVQLVLNSAGTAFKVPDGVTVYVGDTIKFHPDAELLIKGTPTKLSSLTKWHVHYDRDNFPIQYHYYTTNPSTVVNIRTANTTANDSSIDIFDLISLAKHIVDPTTVLGPTA